ncbi:MAG: type II toxin-antitoxin system RelE/ParE family toxin [bacterium]
MWRIDLSKEVDKFVNKQGISDEEIAKIIRRFISYCKGMDINIDVKKMKGKWEGFHRIKMGKIRIILKINFKEQSIFIDRIDYRGQAYK